MRALASSLSIILSGRSNPRCNQTGGVSPSKVFTESSQELELSPSTVGTVSSPAGWTKHIDGRRSRENFHEHHHHNHHQHLHQYQHQHCCTSSSRSAALKTLLAKPVDQPPAAGGQGHAYGLQQPNTSSDPNIRTCCQLWSSMMNELFPVFFYPDFLPLTKWIFRSKLPQITFPRVSRSK